LGNAVENISRFAGFDVKRVDIVNDRGIHICKSMLAYKLFAHVAEPDKKSDHFV
jgi:arginyl-tRNA synthetase